METQFANMEDGELINSQDEALSSKWQSGTKTCSFTI